MIEICVHTFKRGNLKYIKVMVTCNNLFMWIRKKFQKVPCAEKNKAQGVGVQIFQFSFISYWC